MSVQLTNSTRKRMRNLQSNKLHYILILTLLVVLINKIAKFQNSPRNINEVNINYDNLQTNAVYIQLRSKKENRTNKKADQSHRVIIILLLILSNDIHPNPGPKPHTSQFCSLCKKETNEEDSLRCETCSKPCHIKCTSDKDDTTFLHNSSFQWICPNLSSKPNHREGNHLNENNSPNRYQPLEANIETEVQARPKSSKQSPLRSQTTKKEIKSIENQILAVLPQIRPEEYQGKDLCRKCC